MHAMEDPWQSEARSLSTKVLLHAPTRCNLLATLGVSTEHNNIVDTEQVVDIAARLPTAHHAAEQLISINNIGIAEIARNRHEFACFAAFLVDSATMLAHKTMQNRSSIEELQHGVVACSIHASQTNERPDHGPDLQGAEMIFGGDVQCISLADPLRFHCYSVAPGGRTTLRQSYTVQDTYLAHILEQLRTWDPDLTPTTVLPDLQIPPDALNPMEHYTTDSDVPVEASAQPIIASEASLATHTPSCTDSSESSSVGTVDAVELALRARLRSGWPLRNAADDWWREEMAIRGW